MNRCDWLGTGFYFFQEGPDRALKFAKNANADAQSPLTRQPIVTPAVKRGRTGCLELAKALSVGSATCVLTSKFDGLLLRIKAASFGGWNPLKNLSHMEVEADCSRSGRPPLPQAEARSNASGLMPPRWL